MCARTTFQSASSTTRTSMRPSAASVQRSSSRLKMAPALWEPASISLSDSAQAASTER